MSEFNRSLPIVVIGTGPAGLMASSVIAAAGKKVIVAEKRKSFGRKLLVAGSSGLNITFDCPLPEFIANYSAPRERIEPILKAFTPANWLAFIEKLGIGTFKGTSRRYFIEGMKAPALLKRWVSSIEASGGVFQFQKELESFEVDPVQRTVRVSFSGGQEIQAQAVCICLGGGSWEKDEVPLRWPSLFERMKIGFTPFQSSNCGFQVKWPAEFLEEAEGKPIKNVVLSSSRGARQGELVITGYGIEGTPVYFAGEVGTVFLDLKPDLTLEQIEKKLMSPKENLSPIRRVKKYLNLSPAALALIFHLTPKETLNHFRSLIHQIKKFPLQLNSRQPLEEAISSSGGVHWDELNDSLMLKKYPGVFLAGEMLDWDAPTGGFLIQGCVSLGHWAGKELLNYLNENHFERRM